MRTVTHVILFGASDVASKTDPKLNPNSDVILVTTLALLALAAASYRTHLGAGINKNLEKIRVKTARLECTKRSGMCEALGIILTSSRHLIRITHQNQ